MARVDRNGTGQDRRLASCIAAWPAEQGALGIWWLGQHSFVLKHGEHVVYIDPYLSDKPKRLHSPLIRPDEVSNASVIVGTHDHSDHIDRPAWPELAKASPGARFVVPHGHVTLASGELGVAPDHVSGIADGETLTIDDIKITGIAAAHERRELDDATGTDRFMGVVVEMGGVTVYHAGDTCRYEGLLGRLLDLAPDVMMLPINGRDASRLRRGCIGNMTYQEAADLCGEVAPNLAIPAHFDMFGGNTEDPALFVDYMRTKWPDVDVISPRHGERIIVSAGPRP